jgi:hypothetical protein
MGIETHIVTFVVICIFLLHALQLILKAVDDVARVAIQTIPVVKELIKELLDLWKSLW